MVQVLYGGEWLNWQNGGIQTVTLYDDGVLPAGVTKTMNGTGITDNTTSLYIRGGYAYGGAVNGTVIFSPTYDVGNYSKIKVTLNVSTAVNDGIFAIGLANSNTIESALSLYSSKLFSVYRGNLGTGAIALEYDVSAISGKYYIAVGTSVSQYNNDALVATITKITLE